MKNFLRFMIITLVCFCSSASFASALNVLSCQIKECPNCQLLIDIKNEKAEYMDNESSHFLAQKTKETDQRVFETPSSPEIPSAGYRLVFDRKNKTADLIEISAKDKSEKLQYNKSKCLFSNVNLTIE